MVKKRLLLFAFVNDNHIGNVKMLQSIYKQDYENIFLVICNDCTDGFQNERLLYNMNVGCPENIRQVYFQENPYPQGEFLSQKGFWDKSGADYLMIIHSGEWFSTPQALRNCVKNLEYDSSVAAAVTPTERWSDNFKYNVCVYAPANQRILTAADQLSLPENDIRDCMAVYRMAALRSLEIGIDQKQTHISRKLLPALLDQGESVMVLPTPLCRFSDGSVRDLTGSIPGTYGNVKLHEIDNLLKNPTAVMGQGPVQRAVPQPKKRNYGLLLYKFSRFQKLKSYAVIDLLLMICAASLISTGIDSLTIAAPVLFAVAIVLSVWIAAMLICNLYFKKYPQRLVWDDERR